MAIYMNGDTIGGKEIYSDPNFSNSAIDLITNAPGLGDPDTVSGKGTYQNAGYSQGMSGNLNGKFGKLSLTNSSTPNYRTVLYSDLDPSIRDAASKYNIKTYGTDNPTKLGLTNNKMADGFSSSYKGIFNSQPTPDKPEVRGDAFSNFDRRQQVRGVKTGTAAIKRNTMKAARNEAKSIKGKNIFETLKLRKEFKRNARLGAKKEMTDSRASQFKTINNQRKLQNEQGVNSSIGKRNRVIFEKGQKGSPFTLAKFGAINLNEVKSVKTGQNAGANNSSSGDRKKLDDFFKSKGVGGILPSLNSKK